MKLQRDRPVERLWFRVGEIHHQHAIQAGYEVVSLHLQQILVPIVGADHGFIFRRGPHQPAAVIAIEPRGVLSNFAIDLELQPLRNIRGAWLEIHMEENAAIAVTFTLEPQGQMKILVTLFRLQVSVIFRRGQAVDCTLLHIPGLITHLHPAGEVFPVE